MTAIDALAGFVAATRLAEIPDDVAARGALILADCVGCILAGNAAPEVAALVARQRGHDAPGAASVLGTGLRLGPEASAFINGTGGTWHDLDEGNLSTRTHAAIQIVPAALAEAQAGGLSGDRLLEALILAYEASARLWRATAARLAVHPHGTYGPLAACLAIGKLRGLDAGALARSASIALGLGLAASRQTLGDGATLRNIYTGISGRHGFEALALAEAGFSGEADPARTVLGAIYGTAFDAKEAIADLGRTWWIRRSYFKRFASGRYTHGALDLIEELAGRRGAALTAEAVARIDIQTYFLAASMGQQKVRTPFGCRFSIPVLIAARIVQGVRPLTDDSTGTFADPAVHALAERIFVSEIGVATAAYPDRQPTRMTVAYRDGTSEVLAAERILGESDNPLPPGALEAKFRELAGPALKDGAARAWRDLNDIRAIGNVRRMIEGWHDAARAG